MTDPHWPFPQIKYPLTPPKPPEYLDYALKRDRPFGIDPKVASEISTKVVLEDALL